MNNQTLRDAAQYTFVDPTLYVGLVGANPVLSSDDTMANHPGWTEVTAYAGNRPQWQHYGVSENGIVTAQPVEFTFTAGTVVAGVFLSTDGVKGGTAGRLRGPVLMTPVTVASGEKLKVILEAQMRIV